MARTVEEMTKDQKVKYEGAVKALCHHSTRTMSALQELLDKYLVVANEKKGTYKYLPLSEEDEPELHAALVGSVNYHGKPWEGNWCDAAVTLKMNQMFPGLDAKEFWIESIRSKDWGRLTTKGRQGHKSDGDDDISELISDMQVDMVEFKESIQYIVDIYEQKMVDNVRTLQNRLDDLATKVAKIDGRLLQVEAIVTDPGAGKPQKILPFTISTNGTKEPV